NANSSPSAGCHGCSSVWAWSRGREPLRARAPRPRGGLYLTTDPTRVTCLLPEELKTGETTGRCYVMECAAGGDHCTCPLKLPNGWTQPLSGEQCQQLGQLLPPFPPVEPAKAAGKEKPKAPGPAMQVAKDKDENRKVYTVRLQA